MGHFFLDTQEHPEFCESLESGFSNLIPPFTKLTPLNIAQDHLLRQLKN